MYAKKQKPWVKALIVVLILAGLGLGWYLYDTYVDRSGWGNKDGAYFYRDFHGKKITGWLDTENGRYYFQDDYTMATGWLKQEEGTYHLGGDGTVDYGWIKEENSWYHTDDTGILLTGWQEIDGKRYFFARNGAMHTGWLEEEDKTYFMAEDGTLTTGFLTLEDSTYYFDADGLMIRGQITIEDNTYFFTETGTMHTGWLETGEGKVYYLPENGHLASGWQVVDEKDLYFREDGTMHTGWLEQGEYLCYLLSDGTLATGKQEIDGQTHYFTPKGVHVVLVNSTHKVPDYYEVNLVNIDGWHKVSDVCFDALRKMLDDCKAAVGYYEFNSGYRSINDQYAILDARTQENMVGGRSYAAARAIALQSVAVPGTSEHHLGLAVDILGDAAIAWLTEHCWEYGFIVRYQAEKSHITGIIDEPWHYRYVGTLVSLEMQHSGLCLEEYVGAYIEPEVPAEEEPQEETLPTEETAQENT